MVFGIAIKHDQGGKRLEMQCPHLNGLLYVVPAEASWVCSQEHLHAHALAGFFSDLESLKDPHVKDVMRRWGLYFREQPAQPQE